MTLDRFIRPVAIVAAIAWTVAGAIELTVGDHGRAAAYAGVAVVALVVEAAWRVLSSVRR